MMKLFVLLLTVSTIVDANIRQLSGQQKYVDVDSPFDPFNLPHVKQNRSLLWNEFNSKNGLTLINENLAKWRENFKQEIINSLQEVPSNIKQAILKKADEYNKEPWESMKVSDYLTYIRDEDGNRTIFEEEQSRRRSKTAHLVAAELLSNRSGKYIDQIANGLWLTLEESTWNTPAHLYVQLNGSGLPDPNEQVITLRVGETAVMVSFIKFLLYDQLSSYAPKSMMLKRIDYEMNRRIYEPFLSHSNWGWEGFEGNRTINNWNIWINKNILHTALLTLDDVKLRNAFIEKVIHSADFFINGYPDDGGCDEGPSYWDAAGAKLIEFVDLLSSVTNNGLSWSSEQLIHKMGEYIYKIHIDKNRFVNFADASPLVEPDPVKIFRFGLTFNDTRMKDFSSYFYAMNGDESFSRTSNHLPNFVANLLHEKAIKANEPKAPYLRESWMPDLQVLSLRSVEGSPKGLFLGAKGGNNGESHNHNDVGSFILYLNGLPALIDVGSGTYTKQTFGPDRYKIWNMQSQWHNLPTINGIMQQKGGKYKADNVSFEYSPDGGEFDLDIAGAYPKEAHVKKWLRQIHFNGTANALAIKEQFELSQFKNNTLVHFITCLHKIEKLSAGKVKLSGNLEGSPVVTMTVEFDESNFELTHEQKAFEDKKMELHWGTLYVTRLNFTMKNNIKSGSHEFNFKMI